MPVPAETGTRTINTSSSNRSSATFSHTTPADCSLLLLAIIIEGAEATTGTPTFNGNNLTLIEDFTVGPNSNVGIEIWGLIAPGSQTGNIVVNYVSNVNPDAIIALNYRNTLDSSVADATETMVTDISTTGVAPFVFWNYGITWPDPDDQQTSIIYFWGFQGADGLPIVSDTLDAETTLVFNTTTGGSPAQDFSFGVYENINQVNQGTSQGIEASASDQWAAVAIAIYHAHDPILADETIVFDDSATLTAPVAGAIQGAATITFADNAVISALRRGIGTATITFADVATLFGRGFLSGAETVTFTATGVPTAAVQGQGSATITVSDLATLVASGELQGSETITFTATAFPSAIADLTASATITFADLATLQATGQLQGAATIAFASVGTLAGLSMISGAATITFADLATLVGQGELIGSAAITFADVAQLLARGRLQGSESIVFSSVAAAQAFGA